MDGLFGEISAAANAMGMGGGPMQSPTANLNPYASEEPDMRPQPGMQGMEGDKPSEAFSDLQLMEIYEKIKSGDCPPEMIELFNKLRAEAAGGGATKDGKPVVDKEGGMVIQPEKGFVVKTKDVNTKGKVFVNMTKHDHVDPFEQTAVTEEQQKEHGAAQKGMRIPLSLGDIREISDKKGEPAQAIDIIWSPATVEKAKTDPTFRQVMVELAFNYIHQKFNLELDFRYLVPKLSYKGATVQYQRVRAKKAPKIQEVELTDEQRAEMERKNLEEQKAKDALIERKPEWSIYYDMKSDDSILTREYWNGIIDTAFNEQAGDEEDRWNELRENFKLKQSLEEFEEFDGLNHEGAKYMVLLVTLPLLMRGSSVHMRAYDDIFSLRVPNLYKLQLSLPVAVEHEDCLSFFDCKLRRMIIVAPIQVPKTEEIYDGEEYGEDVRDEVIAPPAQVEEDEPKTYEIVDDEPDTQVPATAEEDDLLFDVV